MSRKRAGFTLVEIMIVVAIIGLLSAIAIPAFLKARNSSRRHACINNLRQIDAAKDQYVLEYGGNQGTTLAWGNIMLYVKDVSNKLFCPAATAAQRNFATSYFIQPLGIDPQCQISSGTPPAYDHSLLYKAN